MGVGCGQEWHSLQSLCSPCLWAAPKLCLTGCHRLGYDTPLLEAKFLSPHSPSIDRPLGAGIKGYSCSQNKWKAMLAVFSARQLAQGYSFTLSSFMHEGFPCLFQVIGNEYRAPSLIGPQIPHFHNGSFFCLSVE